MFADLLVGPAPGSQHGGGKFRCGEVVGYIVAGLRIMDFAPACGKAVGDGDDPLEILRPVLFYDCLQHAPQQTVMLSESLDQIVGPGKFPGCQQMHLSLLGLLETHVIHHRHQVQVDGGDGVYLRLHGQCGVHQADAFLVFLLQIGVMSLHIQGKYPQPRRQEGQILLGWRQALRQGKMQKNRGGSGDKDCRCPKLGRGVRTGSGQGVFHCRERVPGPVDLPDGEIGIGIDQAGRKPDLYVGTGEVEFCLPGGLLCMPAEIVILCKGDSLLGTVFHGLDALHTMSRDKRGVHQGHQFQAGGRWLPGRRFGRFFFLSGITRLLGVGRYAPGDAELFDTLDTALCTEFLHQPF